MITVNLNLIMGHYRDDGSFSEWDNVDFEINNFRDSSDCDNINDWLIIQADPICDYAELRLQTTGAMDPGFLIGTFKKIKLKNKGYKWILSD